MARSFLKDVEKESLKRPAIVFTDSDSLANTVKKDVGQSHGRRFGIVVSMLREGFGEAENTSLQWLPTHLQVAGPLTKTMEMDILHSSTVVHFNLWPRKSMRAEQPQKMFNVAAKRVSIAAHENLMPLFSFLFVYCEHL